MSILQSLLQQPTQIAYCLGATNYSWIHFRDGKKKLVAKTLRSLEDQLPGFLRVHKRVLLNPLCIENAYQFPRKKGEGQVYLETGAVLLVSRRRWPVLAQYLHHHPADPTPPLTAQLPPPGAQPPPADSPTPFILLLTEDLDKAHRTAQLIHQQWAAYGLQISQPHTLLTTLEQASSTSVYPTLILLDAHTERAQRMNTLRTLKAASPLSHIPLILFIGPADRFIIEGYQYQANSVVAIPNSADVFEQHLERILHFWLAFAALPGS